MAIKKKLSFSKLQKIKNYLSSRKQDRLKVGVLVDGPNMLRKEFNINLQEIREILSEYWDIKVAKVFLNQYASEKLVEAIENQGFEPIITSGDVDVRMAVEAMELIYNDAIDAIALVTRDADFKSVLKKAMELGKETIIIGAEPGFSAALKNSADLAIVLNEDEGESEGEDVEKEGKERKERKESEEGGENREEGEDESREGSKETRKGTEDGKDERETGEAGEAEAERGDGEQGEKAGRVKKETGKKGRRNGKDGTDTDKGDEEGNQKKNEKAQDSVEGSVIVGNVEEFVEDELY